MTRSQGLVLGLLFAIVVAVGGVLALVRSDGDDNGSDDGAEEARDLIMEASEAITPCVEEVNTAVALIVDASLTPDGNAVLNQVARELGHQSTRWEQVQDIYPDVFREQMSRGTEAAGDLLMQRSTEACMLERGQETN